VAVALASDDLQEPDVAFERGQQFLAPRWTRPPASAPAVEAAQVCELAIGTTVPQLNLADWVPMVSRLKAVVIWRGSDLVLDNLVETVKRLGLIEGGLAPPDARDCLSDCVGLSGEWSCRGCSRWAMWVVLARVAEFAVAEVCDPPGLLVTVVFAVAG
jgi:hypothetical protein